MESVFVEATNDSINWGKFMVARFDEDEWDRRSSIDDRKMVAGRGWGPGHVVVFDLQTGEGALFRHGGLASADLNKTQIWVCVLFEAFLAWLYKQDLTDLEALPRVVELGDVPGALYGYRRTGDGRDDERSELDTVAAAAEGA